LPLGGGPTRAYGYFLRFFSFFRLQSMPALSPPPPSGLRFFAFYELFSSLVRFLKRTPGGFSGFFKNPLKGLFPLVLFVKHQKSLLPCGSELMNLT